MKYVILRETIEATDRLGRPRGGTRAGTATISSPVMPEVEVEELKPHRAASLAHKKEILSVAPVIPMKTDRARSRPGERGPDCEWSNLGRASRWGRHVALLR